MEQRHPLLVPTAFLAFWTVAFYRVEVPSELLLGLAIVLQVIGAMATWRKKHSVALHLTCCAIGCLLASGLSDEHVRARDRFEPSMKARVEGRVSEIRRGTPTVRKYVINGEVDGSSLPCLQTRCLIVERVRDTAIVHPNIGEYRIAFGAIRCPDPTTLPDEQNEVSLCKSLGASFIMDVSTSTLSRSSTELDNIRDRSKEWIVHTLERNLPERSASIATALLIGDRSGLDYESLKAYAASGTAHMFSVSGSHVGMILGILILILGTAPSWWRIALVTVAITLYVIICGAEPPAVRAGLMGIAALIARRTEKDADPINILCGVVFVIVCVQPQTIFQPGMILSVTAVASILVIAPMWYAHILSMIDSPKTWKRTLLAAVATDVAATIGVTLPSLFYFSTTSLTSPLANLAVVPLLGLALVLCVLMCAVSVLGFSSPVAWCADHVIYLADIIARAAGDDSLQHLHPGWQWSIALLFIASMLWPLASKTFVGGIVRVTLGIAFMIFIIQIIPLRVEEDLVALRRGGVVIATRTDDTLLILLDGEHYAPHDPRLYWWAMKQTVPIRCEGRGVWGRRMSGTIRRGVVGWANGDSTRLR